MVYEYQVNDPVSTYLDLRTIINSIAHTSRCLLVPLGPKILSAICVVLSFEREGRLPVWRVSSEHTEEPIDRKSSGVVIDFSLKV